MKITDRLLALLERWGLVKPRSPDKRKPRVPRAERGTRRILCARAARPVSHAEAVKIDLLNAVADALASAPEDLDPLVPVARIKANGSLFILPNTVLSLTVFQNRLEKLKTTTRAPGVPLAARKFKVRS